MKKMILFTLTAVLLCLLSLAAMVYAHGQLTNRGEDVAVTETTLFGDKKEAEGITLTTSGRFVSDDLGKALFWKSISSQRSGGLHTKSSFRFNKADDWYADAAAAPFIYVEVIAGIPERSYEALASLLDDDLKEAIAAAAKDIQPGQTSTQIVSLSDYTDSFPLYFQVLFKDHDDAVLAGDFFHFPLTKDDRWKISVAKDAEGRLKTVSMKPVADIMIQQREAFDDRDNLYLAVTGFSQSYEDWNIPENRRGVLRIPLTGDTGQSLGGHSSSKDQSASDQAVYPDLARAELLYPIDTEAILLAAETDCYRNNLLLFTEEDGQIRLSVIGLDDGQLKQKLTVFADTDNTSDIYPEVRVREEYILIWNESQGSDFLYLCPEDSAGNADDGGTDDDSTDSVTDGGTGKYRVEGQSSIDGVLPEGYRVDKLEDAFDGQRLAIVCMPYDEALRELNSTYLMVFRKSEMVYAGRYDNSLDSVYQAYSYRTRVQPVISPKTPKIEIDGRL